MVVSKLRRIGFKIVKQRCDALALRLLNSPTRVTKSERPMASMKEQINNFLLNLTSVLINRKRSSWY